jgi:hypothetical protein
MAKAWKLPNPVSQARYLDQTRASELDDRRKLLAAYEATKADVTVKLIAPGAAACSNEMARGAMMSKGGPLNRGIRPSGFGTNVSRWKRSSGRFGISAR